MTKEEKQYLDEWIAEFFPKSKMNRFQASMAHLRGMSFLLQEAYKRNENTVDWLDVFKKIQAVSKGVISKSEYDAYLDKFGIGLKAIKGNGQLGGYYSLTTGKVMIQATKDTLEYICNSNENQLRNLADSFWTNFVHEDTHKQQIDKSKIKFKLLKTEKSVGNIDLDDEKDLAYFNQHEEADAYGREIGAKLEKIFPNKNLFEIFDSINYNNIFNDKDIDLYSKIIITVYRDPRITAAAREDFFTSLYEFLTRKEPKIEDLDDSHFTTPEEDQDRMY